MSVGGRAKREATTPEAAVDKACDGVVLVHKNMTVTCTNRACTAGDDPFPRLMNRHTCFVACADALGSICPRCGDDSPPELRIVR